MSHIESLSNFTGTYSELLTGFITVHQFLRMSRINLCTTANWKLTRVVSKFVISYISFQVITVCDIFVLKS